VKDRSYLGPSFTRYDELGKDFFSFLCSSCKVSAHSFCKRFFSSVLFFQVEISALAVSSTSEVNLESCGSIGKTYVLDLYLINRWSISQAP